MKSSTQCTDRRSTFPTSHCTGYRAPRHKKNEHTLDNLHGKCPMVVPFFFFTATAYQSWTLCSSLTHSSTSGSLECNDLFQTHPC